VKLPKRQRAEEAPQGVRINCPGGQTIACDVLRDPDGDRDGLAHWIVVPREPVPDIDPGDGEGFSVSADLLPGKTSLGLEVPLA
jgi:hypothetical protein